MNDYDIQKNDSNDDDDDDDDDDYERIKSILQPYIEENQQLVSLYTYN